MDNNVNNNVSSNVSGNPNLNSNINNNVVNPAEPVATTVVNPAPVNNNSNVASVNSSNIQSINNNSSQNNSNIYLIVGFIVSFVMIAAIFLLVLLVTGVIGNRNRLTCTKTITEDDYVLVNKRVYKFDGNVYTQVNNTDTFTYTNLTNDIYEHKFGSIIENTSGVTEYGFGTQISREGNVVTITSYNPNFFSQTYNNVKSDNEQKGFTCE